MKIAFLGGTGTVTGSKYLVTTDSGAQILVDCGLYQGYKWLRRRNWQGIPLVDPKKLDAIVLTHAHLDHSGYVPVMYKRGFRGPVYCHHATRDLAGIMLPDSGHIQEEDAHFYARHKLSRHEKPEPLYDGQTAMDSLRLLHGINFHQTVTVKDISFYLQPVGHILGAGSLILSADGKRVGFSGDVGRQHDIFMYPPEPLPPLDLLLLESTYGNRFHPNNDPLEEMESVVKEVIEKGGVLLIPSFAVGRAQVIMYILSLLMDAGRIPRLPVFLDSPMAIDVSEVYCRYPQQHRLDREDCHRVCNVAKFTRSVHESKAISDQHFPHIIIAGSGMITGGRILHHMRRLLDNYRTSVLLPGFQAGGTRGDKLLNGAQSIRIHGQWVENRASIHCLTNLSGHGDPAEIFQWLQQSSLDPKTHIRLVHGEAESLEAMRDYLRQRSDYEVEVAEYREILDVSALS
ncbi:MAG: MBL fold metallo-hydrolase [Alcanivorax sp.]|nr:MBL fold metallo-hydrolase [Alcanivorax sp.]